MKDDFLRIRISKEQLEEIKEAAKKDNRTVSSFVLNASLKEAEKIKNKE